ncbi:2-amino-4-hydroxy-6-hydroxymethyldihydropteridine diphosphokinase [Calditrichota bacterium]
MIFNYYLGLGSNIEPRSQFIKNAVKELSEYGKVNAKSSFYESDPWGKKDQNKFINVLIKFESNLKPFNLLKILKTIETNIGRIESDVLWGPRKIDIDIIFADGLNIVKNKLKIPHEYFQSRKFVLIPMAEIDTDYEVQGTEYNIKHFLDNCKDTSFVNKLETTW